MKAFLETINLFSHKISFNFSRNNVYHSFIGIGLSLVMYCLMIYFIFYFSEDFVKKKNPRLTYKEIEFNDEKRINFSYLFDEISVNLTLETNQPKIKNYFISKNASASDYIQMQLVLIDDKRDFSEEENINFNSILKINLTFHRLFTEGNNNQNIISNNNDYNNFYLENNFIYYICKINKNSTFELNQVVEKSYQNGSLFSSEILNIKNANLSDLNFPVTKTTKIDFRILINDQYYSTDLSNSNYKNVNNSKNEKVEINKSNNDNSILENSKFSDLKYNIIYFSRRISYINNIIDVDSDQFFKEIRVENFYFSKNVEMGRTISCRNLLFEVFNNLDDKEFLFSKLIGNWKFHRKSSSTTNLYVNLNEPIVFLSVRFDDVKKKYERVYRKIQNIFADLGGIFSTFILFGKILVQGFNQTKFHYDAVNHIFSGDETESDKNNNKNYKDKDFKNKSIKDIWLNKMQFELGKKDSNNNKSFKKDHFSIESSKKKIGEIKKENYNLEEKSYIKFYNTDSTSLFNNKIEKNPIDILKYNKNFNENNGDSSIDYIDNLKEVHVNKFSKVKSKLSNDSNEKALQVKATYERENLKNKNNGQENSDSNISFDLQVNNEFDSSIEIPKNKNFSKNDNTDISSLKKENNSSSNLIDSINKTHVDISNKKLHSRQMFDNITNNNTTELKFSSDNKAENKKVNSSHKDNTKLYRNTIDTVNFIYNKENELVSIFNINSNNSVKSKIINLNFKNMKNENNTENNKSNPNLNLKENSKNIELELKNDEINNKSIGESKNENQSRAEQESLIKHKISRLRGDMANTTKATKLVLNTEKLIKFTKLDFFRVFICCSKCKSKEFLEKEQIFYNAEEKIYEYLDVLNYLNLNEDFEKLKMVLFNEFQSIAFDLLRKRTYGEIMVKDIYEEKIFETVKYFRENKGNDDYIDKKLNCLFYYEFSELINS